VSGGLDASEFPVSEVSGLGLEYNFDTSISLEDLNNSALLEGLDDLNFGSELNVDFGSIFA
jgi:hypothetical protein